MQPVSVTEEALRAVGIEDTTRAGALLRDLAGHGVTDEDVARLLPPLFDALRESPDADRALAAFARWFASVGNPYAHLQTLVHHPVALQLFCLTTGSSQIFADLLARQPETFELIANPGLRGGVRSAATFYRDIAALLEACRRPELKRDALRRWKAREMLRIGIRDLAALADMPTTAREFSNLADACLQAALDIALSELPAAQPPAFAVIGMGKLGGQELNYSSDIDLMFVHADALPALITLTDGRQMEPQTYLSRLAETLVKTLATDGSSGHVFRVDMRLRPEGRFGPLTRSLASFRGYYESWAEAWERQALIKARFIAGDRALGEKFMALVTPFVYRRLVSESFLKEIRDNKRRIERKCAMEGATEIDIKTGYGGIRDIEFIVQGLQLEYGGVRARLRTSNTLSGIQRLRRARLIGDPIAHRLAGDYIFLRDLEHRLQLLHGFQTQTLPPETDRQERARLARRMGFGEAARFEAALKTRRDRVHYSLLQLFYGQPDAEEAAAPAEADAWPDLRALLDQIDTSEARDLLAARLRTAGFRDVEAALNALQLPMRGNEFGGMPPDTPREFQAIAPRLLDAAARSADPDAALAGLEALALAMPNRAQLYAAFDDSPQMMDLLAQLGGGAPPLMRQLNRHLEWMEVLLNPEESQDEAGAAEPLASSVAPDLSSQSLDAIARFQQREILRLGARDVWEEDDLQATQRGLTRLAETVLRALLDLAATEMAARHSEPGLIADTVSRIALIGLGKLGGAELGYGSDWDVIFVYDDVRKGDSPDRHVAAQEIVERIVAAGAALPVRGAYVEIDLRLRPWGRKGALLTTLRGLIRYHRTDAETWERQAGLKARFLAGSPPVGRRCERVMKAISYGHGLSVEEDLAVQAMKRRIESERLKPAERYTDIKLGHGGLSDIEWLSQRLQMRHGCERHELREPNTLRALSLLAAAHLLDNAEADHLMSAYRLLTRLRNALWLQTGASQDAIPDDPARRHALARLMGYADDSSEYGAGLWDDIGAQMHEARRIFEQRFSS